MTATIGNYGCAGRSLAPSLRSCAIIPGPGLSPSVDLWHDPGTIAFPPLCHPAHRFAPLLRHLHSGGPPHRGPILRHLVLQYPDDPRAATAEYQYLLGESLLVAPVIEQGAVTRKLYLPKGDWLNYWTGEHYTGGTDVSVPAPIDQIPILVRGGAILPFKPEKDTATLDWSDPNLLAGPLVWKVYPAKAETPSTFSLPDGTSATLQTSSTGLRIVGTSPATRSYEVVTAMETEPAAVLLNQLPLPRQNWSYDAAAHQLEATFPDTKHDSRDP